MSTVPSPSHSFLFFSMNSSAVSVNTISYFGYINIARNLENKTNYFTCKHFCGFLSYFFLFFWLPLLVFKYIFVCLLHGLYIHVTYIFCLILYFLENILSPVHGVQSTSFHLVFMKSSRTGIISLPLYNPFDINKYQ